MTRPRCPITGSMPIRRPIRPVAGLAVDPARSYGRGLVGSVAGLLGGLA